MTPSYGSEGLCKRSDLVVSTKIFWGGATAGVAGNPNATGLSRKHIIEGLDASLARMQLKYVDLVFCHRPGLEGSRSFNSSHRSFYPYRGDCASHDSSHQ